MKKITKSPKEISHHRAKYTNHSLKYLDWVQQLGLEKSFIGKLFNRIEEGGIGKRIIVLFIFCFILSFLIFYNFDFTVNLKPGEVAPRDIKSPISFEIVDETTTEAKREAIEKTIPPIFDYNPSAYDHSITKIYQAFRFMRSKLKSISWPTNEYQKEETIKEFLVYKSEFEKILDRTLNDSLFEWLTEKRFSARIENLLIQILENWSTDKIVDTPEQMIQVGQDQVLLRVLGKKGDPKEEYTISKIRLKDINRYEDFTFNEVIGITSMNTRDQRNFLKVAHMIMIPNVTFNMRETTERKQKARDSVLPVVISVKKNQIIINKGTLVQPLHLTFLREIEKVQDEVRARFVTFVVSLLFLAIILVFFFYLKRFSTKKVVIESKDILVMGTVTLLVAIITKIFLFITGAAFVSELGMAIPSEAFLFAAPIAAGPMLVGLLINSGEVVWIFTIFLSVALSFMVDMNFPFLLVSIVGGIIAARAVYGYKKRNDIYWAGLHTGIVNAFIISLIFFTKQNSEENLYLYISWIAIAGFFSGVLSSLVAMMFIPLLESVFNYTTDIKLLELSNLNHPLLKDMVVRAPGTYHHSLVVGSMVEGAAEKIGANPLLAKVMSYYHDIGKTSHAGYFIENQKAGNNPHDHLSPHMSKTILIAHVKDGVELGMKYKLGKPIIDGILQHHGTTLISFFYNKALETLSEDSGSVIEEDFRYPGPKPQFREAALCMLADSIEAAARSLNEPTPLRLRNIVRNIIQRKFMDGQLDECNLTLKDLSEIEAAFIYVLIGIYHQRIDYPKKAGGGASEPSESITKMKNGGNGSATA